MYLKRQIESEIRNELQKGEKVIVLYGPRQAGKTTLSKVIIKELKLTSLLINADQLKYIDLLSSRDLSKLSLLTHGYDLLFIDEGQRIPEIGLNLKILHDEIPDLRVLVTGSSSFLLSKRVTEALTGRKSIFRLLPFSIKELSFKNSNIELVEQLEQQLIYGLYPEVINESGLSAKTKYLIDLTNSYLYKDIIELENIRYPVKIRDLLRLLAFQVGSQVSIHELSKNLKLNHETVERYLHLLEQSFIIFRLAAFSRNPRKEITKSQKFYFYDNGVRNTLIENLNSINMRNDIGQLWENFIISEFKKKLLYEDGFKKGFFWRTYNGVEVDYVEQNEDNLTAFEIKYNKKINKTPKSWSENYGSDYHVINRDNYLEFVL